jgi:isoleucyl-tRNA synthetase
LNDVGNVWLDAGIVPYSTLVDPKTGKVSYITDKKYFEEWFPADFITESFPGQFKNWFYSMIAMSTVLENTNPFKNVLGFATMLGEDGRAMHKSWGNYIEFNEGADKIGVDVMRWMFARQNPTDNMLFGYKRADEVRRQFYLLLWNTYKYYVEYANLEKVKPTDHKKQPESSNVLDIWILTRFNWLIEDVKENLKKFNPKDSAIAMEEFVDDLSTWYIRRSRNRVWVHADSEEDKMGFYHTMHYVLSNLAIMMSPIMPAVTEEIYTELTGEESVHLAFWPEAEEYKDTSVIADMQIVRDIVEVGHRIRKEQKLKVRQVLKAVTITLSKNLAFKEKKYSEQYIKLLSDELNVKDVNIIDGDYTEILVEYDTSMTPELQAEGELRELIRTIQAERKNLGLKLNQSVNLVVPEKFAKSVDEIKKAVYANSITTGAELKVEK